MGRGDGEKRAAAGVRKQEVRHSTGRDSEQEVSRRV